MDAEERALLNAIIAQPEEDTPRMVYADWLQEHDQPERAELIRAQIGLLRTKGDDSATRQRAVWQSRVRVLLQEHSGRWRKELPAIPRVRWGALERGMVESANVAVWEWLPNVTHELASLFGHAPLRSLCVNLYSWRGYRPEECEEVLRWGGLERVNEVRFVIRLGDPNAHPLAPFLARLWAYGWGDRPQVLDLRDVRLSDEAVNPLLSATIRRLPALVMSRAKLSEPVRAALAARLGHGVRFI